jgi:uncharacterized protein (TIGR03067 family)
MEGSVMGKRPRAEQGNRENEVRAHPETLGHLEDCWDEPPPGQVRGRSDSDRLQGAWASTGGRRQAAFFVSGCRFTIHFADGDLYMGTFELDVLARPRAMVVLIEEGPARHKGQSAVCLYELNGDTLLWCTAGPGRTDRPPIFPGHDDPDYLCLVFKRDRLEAPRGE